MPGEGLEHRELTVPAAVAPLTAEQEEVVELELAQMRAWLQGLLPAESHQFSVRVLGGKWTKEHRDVTWDAIQGYARTVQSHSFLVLIACHYLYASDVQNTTARTV